MRPLILALLLFPLSVLAQNSPDPNVELVKRVQEQLHVQGYDVGRVDGVLDVRTQGAVAQFQRDNTLPAGGTLDRETLKALGVDWAEMEVLQVEASPGNASAGASEEQKQ
jgi:peptidoglycan hydrolase-like protein with peptidoglycan-binding domain